jgi:hypothetical protein
MFTLFTSGTRSVSGLYWKKTKDSLSMDFLGNERGKE